MHLMCTVIGSLRGCSDLSNPGLHRETWWHEEHEYLATASWVKKMHIFLPAIRYALTFVGILAALSRHPLHEGAPFINELRNFALVTGGALIMFLLLLQVIMPPAMGLP